MSEETKKEFVDRVSTNINRKKLVIKGIKLDEEGEISELVVEMTRADDLTGTNAVEGTLLNKENLEDIMTKMIKEKLGVTDNE
ncbi:MAG: hypothetical protein IJX78_06510 [Bacilli bacterium]|nr:hypothetical protein [Bacilli bacterium]